MKRDAWLSAVFVIGVSATNLFGTVQANTISLGEGHTPSICSDGHGHLFLVFEGVDSRDGEANIYFTFSTDGGKTWTKRLDVSPTIGVSTRPRIALEKSGAIDVVWTDNPPNESNPDIFFARSKDSGRTWDKPINISHTAGASRDAELAIGPDDTIHVVFSDTRAQSGSKEIFYTSSTDGGKTWSSDQQPENISNTQSDSTEPSIALGSDGILHVAWKEENKSVTAMPQIYYSQRNQNSWSHAVNVTRSRSYNYHPAIACGSSGRFYINWSERSTPEGAANIWCLRARANSLLAHPELVTKTGSIASASELDADKKDRVAIVWPDRALGLTLPKIRVRVLTNTPQASQHSIKISKSSAIQLAPALATNGDKLTVVWEERSLNHNPIKVKSLELPKIMRF